MTSSNEEDTKDVTKEAVEEEPKDEFAEAADRSVIEKKLRKKKPLPDVKFLLQHGDPDAGPQSAAQTAALFFSLFVTFVVSLIVWHFLFLKDAGPGQKKNWGKDEM